TENASKENDWFAEIQEQIVNETEKDFLSGDTVNNAQKCSHTSYPDVVEACDVKSNECDVAETVRVCQKLLPTVIQKLSKDGDLHLTMLEFFKQISDDKFPLNNIAFLLWSEIVHWFDQPNTSRMRYCDDTKQFWKTGWRLFGSRFVHFMSGFKNKNEIMQGISQKSQHSPTTSNVNFAVPDIKILRSFDPYENADRIHPGILNDAISKLGKKIGHVSACLTFDGKKLKQGLTKESGDVDLLGFEDGETLEERRSVLQKTMTELNVLSASISMQCKRRTHISDMPKELKSNMKNVLVHSLKRLSSGMNEMEQLKKKKEYAKEKLIERGGDSNWRNGKFSYAISAILGYMHDITAFTKKAGDVIKDICIIVSALNGSTFVDDIYVDIKSMDTYKAIEELSSVSTSPSTRLVKQRSEEWFQIRSAAKVTGSTLHKCLGLDGLKSQKEYLEKVICGLPENDFPENVKQAMKHGEESEIYAVATLVGKIAPVLYPEYLVCEEGCVVFRDEHLKPYFVVSPDGSLRKGPSQTDTKVALEIKCPMREAHTYFPQRYLLQCLSEMEALDVDRLLYVSWTETKTSVFQLKRNTMLFSKAMSLARKQTLPNKLPDGLKILKDEIQKESKNAKFLGLFQSAKDGESENTNTLQITRTVDEAITLIMNIADLHECMYELKRQRASESVVFICADLNRSWNKSICLSAPVSWFTKGYSLDTKTMRNIAEKVYNQCHDAGLHIPCQSFDGQWHNIVTRSADNRPLTILQLQKDVWHEVEQMKKAQIISKFIEMNKCPKWFFKRSPGLCEIHVSNHMNNVPPIKRKTNQTMTANEKKTVPIGEAQGIDVVNVVSGEKDEDNEDVETNRDEICKSPFTLHDNKKDRSQPKAYVSEKDAKYILALLRTDKSSNKKGKWDSSEPDDIKQILTSSEKLVSLLDVDLRVIVRYFKKIKQIEVKEIATKQAKLDVLSLRLGLSIPRNEKKCLPKKPSTIASLSKLSTKVLSKCAIAECMWSDRYIKWIAEGRVSNNMQIDGGCACREWFYQPEYSLRRNQLEVKCIVATHLLTRTRRKSCKGGLDNLSNAAWRKVAKDGNTLLTPIMVDEVTDPMSSSMATTHFSEAVELEMRKTGEIKSADLCRDVRLWWEAEDSSGMTAIERFNMREGLRTRLLSRINFSRFPPPTMYVNGWPIQLWEALIAHIDSKTILYALCHGGTYNVRAFSSLIGETFFSELVLHDRTGCGTVTADEFGRFIGNAIEQLHVRLDPD
ncbi:hypothetical protein MAR_005249, partial [Mya arenaria]